MSEKRVSVNEVSELRSTAEKLLGENQIKSPDSSASPDEMKRLVHELEVHQIELEMQQKELLLMRDELEKNLKRYTDLYDFAPLGYLTIARDSSIFEANLMAAQILGTERSCLTGSQLSNYITPEDLHLFAALVDKVFNRQTSKCCEVLRLKEAGGRARPGKSTEIVTPLTVSIDAVVSETGEECQVILSDISRLKEIEKAMLVTNERLQLVMDATHSGTWEWDLETISHIWSDNVWKAKEGFGLEPLSSNASYDLWQQFLLPEEREVIDKIVLDAIKKEEEFTVEWRLRDSSGRDHWVMSKGSPIRDTDNRVRGYAGIIVDISDLKNAREISNKAKTLNKSIIESIPGPFYIIDQKGFYAGWNAFDREVIAGKPESEMVNMQVIEAVHPEDRALIQEKIAIVFEQGVDVSVEGRIMLHGGPQFRWFLMNARRVIIDGNPYLIGIGTDVTERKKIEEVHRFLSHTSYYSQDEPFFYALARYLAESLGFDFVCIDSLEGDGLTARTLAVLSDGNFDDNMVYALKDTPCGEVVRKNICCFPANVCQSFPHDQVLQDLQAESYAGVTLMDHSGHPIGLIALIGRRPLSDHRMVEAILKIISVRAAGELERLQNEDVLRESEKKYQELFESVPIGLCKTTMDGKIITANQACLDISRCPESERDMWYEQEKRTSYVHPEDSARFRDALLKHDYVNNFEVELFRKDGTIAWLSHSAKIVRSKNGQPDYIADSFIDVTKRKHAEEELKKLSVAITQSPAVVVITDPDGNIEYVNPAFSQLTGYSFEEVKGKNPRILQSGLMPKDIYNNLWETILSGGFWQGEFENRKKNGELYWETAVISAIRDEKGEITNFVAVKEDITEKKGLWDKLVKNKAMLDAAMESMTDAVIITDLEGRFIEFNTAFAKFHRFRNKKEYLTTLADYPSIFNLFKLNGTPVPFEQWPLPRALRGETGIAVEYVLKRKDTGEKWIGSYNFAPIRDHKGNITGSIISGRDVTHLKEAEKAIRESEERFRKFFEQHSAAMMVLDPESGSIVDVNNAAAEYYGWSRERLTRMSVIDLNTDKPEDSRKHLAEWQNATTRIFTVNQRLADGTNHDIEVFGQKILVQNKWLALLILHDITERKQYQKALIESNERLHYILNAANAGIWEADLTTNQSYWSDELWMLYGVEPNSFQLTFDSMANSVLPEDRHSYEKAIADAVNTASELNVNWRIKDTRGNIRWLLCKGNPVRDSNGNAVKYVGIVLDISRQKMMEEENRQLESRIQKAQRLETIGTLAGGIAHDFNNILTPILGFAEMGVMKVPEKEPLHDYFREIMMASERAQNLVSQILTFGKEKVSLSQPFIVCVQSLAEEALHLLRPSIPSNIRIEQQIDPSCRNILADPSKIHQVIVNLCTNAYNAMEKTGGTLTIKLDEITPDTNLLKRLPELHDQPYVRLTVSDTGCGMDKSTMDHIFEPFFTTKPVNKGTGLGLSVVYGIITGYNGVINVESQPGKGSSFQIFLPIVDQKITCSHRNDVVPKGNARILFIDDEETTLKIVTIMLTELGYCIRAFNSPRKAVELFGQSPDDFDLVITDLTMPEMTGFDVASEIHACRSDMPVILMTGYGKDMDNAEELEKHGIRQLLKKPVKVETLVTTINNVLCQ